MPAITSPLRGQRCMRKAQLRAQTDLERVRALAQAPHTHVRRDSVASTHRGLNRRQKLGVPVPKGRSQPRHPNGTHSFMHAARCRGYIRGRFGSANVAGASRRRRRALVVDLDARGACSSAISITDRVRACARSLIADGGNQPNPPNVLHASCMQRMACNCCSARSGIAIDLGLDYFRVL